MTAPKNSTLRRRSDLGAAKPSESARTSSLLSDSGRGAGIFDRPNPDVEWPQRDLASMNDSGCTFAEIADAIEASL